MEQMEQQKLDEQKLSFGQINLKNLELFKLLTTLTLPVTYSDHFYFKILQYSELSRIAFFNDVAVGSITCREEVHNGKKYAYIMTFGVLSSYRRLGFGSQILQEIVANIKKNSSIRAIYLHMWTDNKAGYQFYLNQGFEQVNELKGYYQDIEPPDCYVMRKKLYPEEDKDDDLIVNEETKSQPANSSKVQ